ncbi:carcinoembryonic antigen-related cell adhesion molecule 18-like [Gracilinanus agilis]|uniref:carcinoembryonic antigen-related cell adhesion molecule 18-like n=1 Tax=Gracilinanus agilis TaxID=191870 RepID=UPI001CFEB8A8|nr:carcinoembryonic antigen-related cell adhesion molecule 18-like [Gracilinanus agilis]
MELPPEPLLFKRLLLTVVLLVSTAAAQLALIPDQLDAEKDSSLTWYIEGAPTGDVTFTWYRGNESLEANKLISYVNSSQSWIPGLGNTGRENVTNKGFLTITKLEFSDSGIYKLVATSPGEHQEAIGQMQVWDRLLKPNITVSNTSVQAYMDEVTFTCHPNNTSEFQIRWIGIYSFQSGQWKLSSDNRTLTGWVSPYDRGPYRCEVSSLVSWESSDSVMLNVYHGPNSISKTSSPTHFGGVVKAELGWKVTLKCSATSVPSCLYRWHLNGTALATTNNILNIESMSWGQVGTYRCIAENPRTQVVLYDIFVLKVSEEFLIREPEYTLYQGSVILLSIGVGLGLLNLIGGLIFCLVSRR